MKLNSALAKLAIVIAGVPTTSVLANDIGAGNISIDDESESSRNVRSLADNINRKLQDEMIPCNSIIDIQSLTYLKQTVKEITAFKAAQMKEKYPELESVDAELAVLIQEKIPMMEHGVQIMKVCASCNSEGLNGYGCDVDDYGFDSKHSGIALLPVKIHEGNKVEASIIDTADELQTWIGMRSIVISQADIGPILGIGGSVLEYALMAASMGLVGVLPEQMGYGESAKEENGALVPSILNTKSKTTSTLPLFAKAKSIVAKMSNGRTVVGNEAYFLGYSEGGFSAVAVAHGFEKHGITPIKVMSGGGPLKVRSATLFGIFQGLLSDPADPFAAIFTALAGLPLSDTRPGTANYEQGQPLLNPTYASAALALITDQNVPGVYTSGAEDYFKYVGINHSGVFGPTFFSPNFLAFFLAAINTGDVDPCVSIPISQQELGGVDKLCAALDEDDMTDVVINAPYLIELCHGEADTMIVPAGVPDSTKLKYSIPGAGHSPAATHCAFKFLAGTTVKKPKIRSKEGTRKASKSHKSKASKSGKKSPKMKKAHKVY